MTSCGTTATARSIRATGDAEAAALLQTRKHRVDALQVPAMTIGASLRDQQVFLDAQRRKDAPALRHEPHSAAHRLERRDRRDVRALEENPSAPRRSKTHDRV